MDWLDPKSVGQVATAAAALAGVFAALASLSVAGRLRSAIERDHRVCLAATDAAARGVLARSINRRTFRLAAHIEVPPRRYLLTAIVFVYAGLFVAAILMDATQNPSEVAAAGATIVLSILSLFCDLESIGALARARFLTPFSRNAPKVRNSFIMVAKTWQWISAVLLVAAGAAAAAGLFLGRRREGENTTITVVLMVLTFAVFASTAGYAVRIRLTRIRRIEHWRDRVGELRDELRDAQAKVAEANARFASAPRDTTESGAAYFAVMHFELQVDRLRERIQKELDAVGFTRRTGVKKVDRRNRRIALRFLDNPDGTPASAL